MRIWVLFCAAVVISTRCFTSDILPPRSHLNAAHTNPPISFEANIGQADPAVEFLAHGRNGNLLLTGNEAWLTLQKSGQGSEPGVLRLKLPGANPHPQLEGLDLLPGRANYFGGNDPGRWRTNAPTFAKVRYGDVYPGVDLVYYGNQQKLEYDFVVHPGADPNLIALEFAGAEAISLEANGDLLLQLPGDLVRQHRPVVYQEVNGSRKLLVGDYILRPDRQVGFRVADYDRTRPLIIDPVLSYSATFGGGGLNQALAIALDAQGNVYVTGNTTAADFPIVNAVQAGFLGTQDVFVTKFDTNGAIVYSTFLGGGAFGHIDAYSSGQGIAVDAEGDAVVTGYTGATNFPTANALQPIHGGGIDAFVTKLNPAGNALLYSTFLGGTGFDAANAIALATNGDAIITGYTQSTNFPTANAAQPAYGGTGDAFVARLGADGGTLTYSTYLGGSGSENNGVSLLVGLPSYVIAHFGGALAVDFDGNAFVTGWTYSTNFPVLNAFQPTNGTSYYDLFGAAFITKFDPAGSLVYSTYLGGGQGDFGRAIGVDFNDNVYVAGSDGGDFGGGLPITNAFQPAFGGGPHIGDGFVAAFDATGTNLIYCTYLGGSGDEQINGIAVRPEDGAVVVTGFTDSPDFPLVDAVQPTGYQGLFKSTDGASSWNFSNSGLTSGIIYSIEVDPSDASVIYVLAASGYEPGVFKSTDGGAHWALMSSGLGYVPAGFNPDGSLLALDPLHPGTLYAGGYGAVFKTTDGAAHWTSGTNGLPATAIVQTVAVDPVTPTTLYLGTSSKGAFKSTDGGNSWNLITNGLNNMNVRALLVDPQNPSNVYAGVDNLFSASLFKSTDGGGNWTVLGGGLPTGPVVALAAGSSMIYAMLGDGISSSALEVSADGGGHWSQLLESLGLQFTALAVAAPSASASMPALGIGLSGNTASFSWPASFAGYALESTPSLNSADWQGVVTSPVVDNGNNVVTIPLSDTQGYFRLRSTGSSPAVPTLFLGTDEASGEGVLKSTDGGNIWYAVGFPGDTINAVAVNPADPATVYAGFAGGRDGFVASLSPDGQLYSSTYLGGSGADQGNAIALDFDTAYIAGSTSSSDFPTTAAPSLAGRSRIKPAGAKPMGDPPGAPPIIPPTSPPIKGSPPGANRSTASVTWVGPVFNCPKSETRPPLTWKIGNSQYQSQGGFPPQGSFTIRGTAFGTSPIPGMNLKSDDNLKNSNWTEVFLSGKPTTPGVYDVFFDYFVPPDCHWTISRTITVIP